MRNRMCFDCLHCKVSARSTMRGRLCFCAMSKKRERHREPYWLAKKICKKFESMGA
jgi:hypothetical protein